MASSLARLLPQLSRLATPDRDLLERFHHERDEAAFALLVERHGSMVLNVCQRLLGDRHAAQDACQAVFLVLARRAGTLGARDSVAGWLHGVARRVALNARRRTRPITLAARLPEPRDPHPDPLAELSVRDLLAVVEEELARLPEAYRLALVLCALEGQSQEEAAHRLGCTPGALRGRLERGRARLHARLARRGITLTAALAAMEVTRTGASAALRQATVQAALAFVQHGSTAAISAEVLALARAAMPASKVKALTLLVLGLGLVALGAGALQAPPEEKPPSPPRVQIERPARTDLYGDPLPEGAVARLGTLRFNHGQGLDNVLFSPDGTSILSSGRGHLRRWDIATGKEQAHFSLPNSSFEFSSGIMPDGKTLACLENYAGVVRILDAAEGKELRTIRLPVDHTEGWSVNRKNELSPDGRLWALHSLYAIRVFEVETGRRLYGLPGEFRAVTFAAKQWLVTADNKKQLIEVWDAHSGKPVRQLAHGAPVAVLAVSADGRRLATLEHHTYAIDRLLERDVIQVWDLATGTKLHVLAARPQRWFMRVQLSADGRLLSAASTGENVREVTVWDATTGQRLHELPRTSGPLAFSPDGRHLATGLALWDLQSGRRLREHEFRGVFAKTLFLSPTGQHALTLGYDTLDRWDGNTGRPLDSLDLPPFFSYHPFRIASPDGRYAITFAGNYAKTDILLWDVAARRRLHTLRPPGANQSMTFAFSPYSSMLVSSHYDKETILRLWDVQTGKELRSFTDRKTGWFPQLFFTPDGQTLYVVGRQVVGLDVRAGRELFSWRMAPPQYPRTKKEVMVEKGTGKVVAQEEPSAFRILTISPDGTLAAGILQGGDSNRPLPDRIVLCDARTGKVLRRWSDSGKSMPEIESLAFSPDSRLLATSDGALFHLWEVATGQEVHRFEGHRGDVGALVFSAGGRRLASLGDSTALIWDLALAMRPSSAPPATPWSDLASPDVPRAHAALWQLVETPEAAVALLRQHLKPVTTAHLQQLRRHIADLGSDTYAVRTRAFQQLQKLSLAAESALRQAAAKEAPLELRRRLEQLLDDIHKNPTTGESLRQLRALTVLEQVGTPEARRLLQELAEGAGEGWLTQQARAGLARRKTAAR